VTLAHATVDPGVPVDVAGLEDIVLSSLEWAKPGESARQLEDVAALVGLWRDELDSQCVNQWVTALELEPQWRAALAAGPLTPMLRRTGTRS